MELIEYADAEMMAMQLANRLAGELRQILGHSERVTFVVPGGNTPGPVFDALCGAELDWERVDVMLSDERWVPEKHLRSNTRLLRERLLVGRAAAARFVPLFQRVEQPEEVIEELSAGIEAHLPVSVLLLGMGEDMHTASLFPGSDGLEAAMSVDAPVLVPVRVAGEAEARVTLSARVLRGAVSAHVVISGAQKRAALASAQQSAPDRAPIKLFLEQAVVHWADS